MTIISGVTGSGAHTSLKQFLATLPEPADNALVEDQVELKVGTSYQASIARGDPNPKGGVYGARKFLRVLKSLSRSESDGFLQYEPVPILSRLNKRRRANGLGYSPTPRQRSSTARGRRAALMVVLEKRVRTQRNREMAGACAR